MSDGTRLLSLAGLQTDLIKLAEGLELIHLLLEDFYRYEPSTDYRRLWLDAANKKIREALHE